LKTLTGKDRDTAMTQGQDAFGARATLTGVDGNPTYYRLAALAEAGLTNLDRLPHTVKILLENVLRYCGRLTATQDDVKRLAGWDPANTNRSPFPFLPARVLLQDYTGVPAVVDLAAMRSAMQRLGGHPDKINPLLPSDLVIDHSVQVDTFGSNLAFQANVEREYERNGERYALLRWFQQAFRNASVVPPGTGIVHQVNLEYLARVVQLREQGGETVAFPDTLVGLDSHTTMINGLGVLAWGVGGIEAEGAMLGQPLDLLQPEVIGVRLTGALREGATATDLVLTVTEMLRRYGVVGRFVEFCGAGLTNITVADRATISNMSPEFGATASLFPVDAETLRYLRMTGRDKAAELVERFTKEQGLFRTDDSPDPAFTDLLQLDLSSVESSLAGPRRPQDRVPLEAVGRSFRDVFADRIFSASSGPSSEGDGAATTPSGSGQALASPMVAVTAGEEAELNHGSVVIAAITSCTNTSNPSVMIGAGILAKKAVERGLRVKPYVKTSLAPGSRAVTDYLSKAGLTSYLEALGYQLVGYGCTTCIGNSGPLPDPVAKTVTDNDLVVAAVLSGNRNFEGRIHPQVRASYLASPPLVVAYALAGSVDVDLTKDSLGYDRSGQPVYLRDIWPTQEEVNQTMAATVDADLFEKSYSDVFEGDERWRGMAIPEGALWEWDPKSTYIQEPPYFENFAMEPGEPGDISGARVLAVLGDSITTDHISPAGSIPVDSPAGRYLIEHGVEPRDFNQFGARRGAHEVMLRGTFGNIRLRNELVAGREGNWTEHLPSGEVVSIYDAAMKYKETGTPLIVIGGKEYGQGSSRDWAAKGPMLQGVQAVLVESFERIHRSNLVMMGILPLQFMPGETRSSLGLSGRETFNIRGIAGGLQPGQQLTVEVTRESGEASSFKVVARIDSPIEIDYYRHGGILPLVLRNLLREGKAEGSAPVPSPR
jgi:aconitate hydratase